MELKENCEIIGILESLESTKYTLKLKFKMIKLIELPLKSLPIKKMQEMQGKQIGILYVNGKYKFREINDEQQR